MSLKSTAAHAEDDDSDLPKRKRRGGKAWKSVGMRAVHMLWRHTRRGCWPGRRRAPASRMVPHGPKARPRPTPLLSPGSDSTASQSAPPTVRFDDTELLGKLAAIEGKLESQAAEMKKVAEATKPGGCCAIS